MNSISKRIFGLDLMRSVAIFIVMVTHSSFLLSNFFETSKFNCPIDGVDLFFVLSGFLVGKIIITTVNQTQKFTTLTTLNFLKRRWFRTLPNYFLFLLINIILVYFGLISGTLNKFLVTYFIFFQNLYKPFDFLFWESWSLCVEEWFYFLFPLIIVLLFKFKKYKVKPKSVIFFTIILFLLIPLFYRFYQSSYNLNWDLYYRKIVLTRLDTIGYGLLASFVYFYNINFWTKYKNSLAIIGVTILIIITQTTTHKVFFMETFYFSLIGIAIALLLPKLSSFKNETIPFKPFNFISKISFSMYLVHIPLLQILPKLISVNNKFECVLMYLLFWVGTIIASALIYKLYELPIMNLRDKISINC